MADFAMTHQLDKKRTKYHEYEAMFGDGWETWCICGQKITGKGLAYWSEIVEAHEKHQRDEMVK